MNLSIKKELPSHVTLLAASKGQSIEKIKSAFEKGITLFGENYVQELLGKIEQIERWPQKPVFHFIGRLQTNKVKMIIDKVAMIQSVDSLKLLQKIETEAQKHKVTMSVLLQVNMGKEKSKSGISPDQLISFVKTLPQLQHVVIRGLMAIPPYCENPEDSRLYFKLMKQLADQLGLSTLSIGMSHDYTVAIEEGATLIRLGEVIFGAR